MEQLIKGLHHVTATVDDAQRDLDFYVKSMGMRLVKKTVNFDNHDVYHFYYGTEAGNPGTIMTTFPYKGRGVAAGLQGAGQITVTSFSVPGGSLDFWKARFVGMGMTVETQSERFGDESLMVRDPSGLAIELIATDADPRDPWITDQVDASRSVRGLHGVSLTIAEPRKTFWLLQEILGFAVVDEQDGRTRLAVNGGTAGRIVEIVESPEAMPAVNGLGTVHHVAFAIDDPDQQLQMRNELVELGFAVTPVLDRQYFRSIYFREPGGVLFEIATIPPGFTVDEDLSALGRELKLPPWEESSRSYIEQNLDTVAH